MFSSAKVRAILGSKFSLLGALVVSAVGLSSRDPSLTVGGLILMLMAVTNWLPRAVVPKSREDAERLAKEAVSQSPVRAMLGSRYTLLAAFVITSAGMWTRDHSLTVGGLILMLTVVTSWLPPTVFAKNRSQS